MQSEKIETLALRAELTKQEQAVFRYLMEHREQAAVMTSSELARAAEVGDTSVIRLARTLGFENFKAFRRQLQTEALEVSQKLENSHLPYEKIRSADRLRAEEIPEAIRRQFASRAACDQIENGDGKYLEAAGLLLKARRRFVAGFRNTAGLADYFTTVMSHVLPEVRNINRRDGFEDGAADMEEGDVLVLFSLPRYSRHAITAAEIAAEAGCPIIAVTDSTLSPVAEHASVTITNRVDSLSFANSVSSMVLSMEILITLAGKMTGEDGRKRLERLDSYMEETGLF